MLIQITPLYASILVLIFLALSVHVVRLRRARKIGVGSGQVPELELAVRVHGNFSEYVPLAVLLLLFMELNGVGAAWLHAYGGLLVIARILHAAGLGKSAGITAGRVAGTALTWTLMLVAVLVNLWLVFARASIMSSPVA